MCIHILPYNKSTMSVAVTSTQVENCSSASRTHNAMLRIEFAMSEPLYSHASRTSPPTPTPFLLFTHPE